MKPKTLAWWRWNLKAEVRSRSKKDVKPKLLPVVVAEAFTSAPSVIEVTIVEAVTLRVPTGSDVAFVADLIRAVRATC